MKKVFAAAVLVGGAFIATYAAGQVYEGRHEAMTGPLDHAAEEHAETYANVRAVGEEMESLSEHEQYLNMTQDMNAAGERHLDVLHEQN